MYPCLQRHFKTIPWIIPTNAMVAKRHNVYEDLLKSRWVKEKNLPRFIARP